MKGVSLFAPLSLLSTPNLRTNVLEIGAKFKIQFRQQQKHAKREREGLKFGLGSYNWTCKGTRSNTNVFEAQHNQLEDGFLQRIKQPTFSPKSL